MFRQIIELRDRLRGSPGLTKEQRQEIYQEARQVLFDGLKRIYDEGIFSTQDILIYLRSIVGPYCAYGGDHYFYRTISRGYWNQPNRFGDTYWFDREGDRENPYQRSGHVIIRMRADRMWALGIVEGDLYARADPGQSGQAFILHHAARAEMTQDIEVYDPELGRWITGDEYAAYRNARPTLEMELRDAGAAVNRTHLRDVATSELINVDAVLDELKRDPFIAAQMASSVGVREGLTLEEHVRLVFRQYNRYLSGRPLPQGVSRSFLCLFLALHDLGKPKAAYEGETERQYGYSTKIVEELFPRLGMNADEVRIARSLVSGDPMGDWVKGCVSTFGGKEELIIDSIRQRARETGMPVDQYLDLLIIYYLADASSYTEDAGITYPAGTRGLDDLFTFDPSAREMDILDPAFFSELREKLLSDSQAPAPPGDASTPPPAGSGGGSDGSGRTKP